MNNVQSHEFDPSKEFCHGDNTQVGSFLYYHRFCEKCGSCITINCTCYKEHSNGESQKVISKSQKVNGIKSLMEHVVTFNGLINVANIIHHFMTDQSVEKFRSSFNDGKGYFARPCPVTPKHGFVDSRIIKNSDELRQIWKETRAADPEGELILMEPIDSSHNAILTNNQLVVGPGHDGATSGKNTITFPFVEKTKTFNHYMLNSAEITEAPYFEVVYKIDPGSNYRPVFTQLRNGPSITTCPDFIPRSMTVQQIIRVNGGEDLIEWDKKITALKGNRNVVVYHRGGSLACHYGVHCVINNVAYVTSFEPVVGQLLQKQKEQRHKLDYRQVQQGYGYSMSSDFTQYLVATTQTAEEFYYYATTMLNCCLYSLHNFAALTSAQSYFLGFSIGCAIRLGLIAGYGEARHMKNIKRELKKRLNESVTRHGVYLNVCRDFDKKLSNIRLLYGIFRDGEWGNAYGGKRWANCVDQTIELINKAAVFYRRPTQGTFAPVITQLNELINAVHNGGQFLNKFAYYKEFDLAVGKPGIHVLVHGKRFFEIQQHLSQVEMTRYSFNKLKKVRNKLSQEQEMKLEGLLEGQRNICNNCGELKGDCDNYCRLELEE